jgi:hypothetical protein
MNIDIVGISEARWTSFGEERTPSGGKFLFSGKPDGHPHEYGVGFLLSKEASKCLLAWKPVNERIMLARFKTRVRPVTIVQAYASTDSAENSEKEKFYNELQATMSKIKRQDIVIVMGDFNATVGSDNEHLEHVMGRYGMGTITENGELFTEFCFENDLVIGGSLFPHKTCHKYTWTHPRTRDGYQLDHVCISRKWRGSLLDVRNRRSADIQSDHEMLVAEVRLKIARVQNLPQTAAKKFDIQKLRDRKTGKIFAEKVKDLELLHGIDPNDVNSAWSRIRDGIIRVSEEVLGRRPPRKKDWISEDTWKMVEARRAVKNAKDDVGVQLYRELCRSCTLALRRDKRREIEDLARQAEDAANLRDLKRLYELTRKLANTTNAREVPVRDKQGRLLVTTEAQLNRWQEHFKETLNFECNASEADTTTEAPSPSSSFSSKPPTKTEIRNAIKEMKNGKAAGVDQISAEMLKADVNLFAELLFPIFCMIWDKEKLPDDWLQGILVKIPKKGDLSNCNNWRGITLLSIPSKVLAKVILHRIAHKIDETVRKEQAGFRPGRSCIDQINTLRIIIEQMSEMNNPLHMCFIDYEKAFDRVSRHSIWHALEKRNVPPKLMALIRSLYDGYETKVLHSGNLSAPFSTISGVRQGCILSPILFLCAIDEILHSALDDKKRGIWWTPFEHLEDLDFADDIVLFSQNATKMQSKLNDLQAESEKSNMKINVSKTVSMSNDLSRNAKFTIGGHEVEKVDKFTYLGSVITTTGGAGDDVRTRIRKAEAAFAQLRNIWSSNIIHWKTKVRIFSSNVKSVLLYACETWPVTEEITRRIQGFINRKLRIVRRDFWPHRMSTAELWESCHQIRPANEVKKRKWGWIGHTLRKKSDEIPRKALEWNPQGKRRPGRPKTTWRRTIQKELEAAGLKWEEVKIAAPNRQRFRTMSEALYS